MKNRILFSWLIILLFGNVSMAQEDEWSDWDDWEESGESPFELAGFIDSRHSLRILDDPYQPNHFIISESKFQLELGLVTEWMELRGKGDFLYDNRQDTFYYDIREASLFLTPADWIDLKVGRQILTWGKGDLLFINDLFPKNWQAFFNGSELEYLKAPSEAAKLTLNILSFEINGVYIPVFDEDVFVTGERLSFFDPVIGRFRGDSNILMTNPPNVRYEDHEIAWRLRRNIGSFDLAFYGYYGFWKSPAGFDPLTGMYTFPKLDVYGMSFEGNMFGGVFSLEAGYYESKEDIDGDNFTVPNSEYRLLVGQSWDLKNDFQIGMQYYGEMIAQYEAFLSSLPPGVVPLKERNDTVTLRLTKLFNKQKVNLTLFGYYSITDNDAYIRSNLSIKLNDYWKIDFGSNYFLGEIETTFWNQFQHNNNIYSGLKLSF